MFSTLSMTLLVTVTLHQRPVVVILGPSDFFRGWVGAPMNDPLNIVLASLLVLPGMSSDVNVDGMNPVAHGT